MRIVVMGTDAVARRFPDDALKIARRSIGVANVRISAATNFHNVMARWTKDSRVISMF